MALQASGPISWSQIVEEFGNPASNTTTTFYHVPWVKWTPQTDWVLARLGGGMASTPNWSQFLVDYGVQPSNTDPLVGTHSATWRIDFSTGGTGSYTIEVQADDSATIKLYGDNLV